MRKTFLRLGSLFAMLAVMLGAFGAHGLQEVILPERMITYETGVRYQFYHALAIVMIGTLYYFGKKSFLRYAGWSFIAGILCFSGSLYLLSLSDILEVPAEILGPITPIGGTFFIAGWVLLFLATFQRPE